MKNTILVLMFLLMVLSVKAQHGSEIIPTVDLENYDGRLFEYLIVQNTVHSAKFQFDEYYQFKNGQWVLLPESFLQKSDYQISDENLKFGFTDISYGLTQILALRPEQFSYKLDSTSALGFRAQHLINHVPEAVLGSDGYYTISYTQLIPVLTKGMQQQQDVIQNLLDSTQLLNSNYENLLLNYENLHDEVNSLKLRLNILERKLK